MYEFIKVKVLKNKKTKQGIVFLPKKKYGGKLPDSVEIKFKRVRSVKK